MRTVRRQIARRAAFSLLFSCGLVPLLPAVGVAQVTARTLIGRAVSDDAQDKDVENAIERFRNRDIDGCRAILERARANNPKLPPVGVMMATLWLSVNQIGPARGELEDAVIKHATDPEAFLMLADIGFQERRISDAAVLFEKATTLTGGFTENPKRKRDFEIRCNAGNAAVAEGRRQWETAQKYLKAWLDLDPDSIGAHQRMGIALFKLDKEADALAQFREAKKLDDKSPQPEIALARLYDDDKKRDVAKKWIESAVKAAPSDPGVLLASAQWYIQQNDLETARATIDNVLKLEPKNLDGKILRGVVARLARDYKTAEKYFNDAHTQSPGNFGASNSLALVLVESDDKESRQRALEMAEVNVAMNSRENSPNQVPALTTLAWVFYKLGRQEDAGKILDQIARSNALTSDGAYYVAKLLSEKGERDKARQILDQVLAAEPMFATRPDALDLQAKLKK
ncbi:MAG: tetratricopeptide repeat protein, partial [Planctomycetia bacterium]